jgi:host factor-I protein
MEYRQQGHRRFAGRRARSESGPPESTLREVRYIRYLISNDIPVRIRLRDNQEVSGTIEYYDQSFIRLTQKDKPNLFIYKHQIKYLYEEEQTAGGASQQAGARRPERP